MQIAPQYYSNLQSDSLYYMTGQSLNVPVAVADPNLPQAPADQHPNFIISSAHAAYHQFRNTNLNTSNEAGGVDEEERELGEDSDELEQEEMRGAEHRAVAAQETYQVVNDQADMINISID